MDTVPPSSRDRRKTRTGTYDPVFDIEIGKPYPLNARFRRGPNNDCIYTITNLQTGRVYVGATYNLPDRIRDHERQLFHGNHCNRKLQADYKECGIAAFEVRVVQRGSRGGAERHWLDHITETLGLKTYNLSAV